MTPRWRSDLTGSEVYEADARAVAATLPDGLVTCSILDGPYGMGKAEWDRIPRGGSLGDLYTGHLDDVGRLSAPSASLYLWNTSGGWAELHPLILARGWTFRSLIVWDKVISPEMLRETLWSDVTEVCGVYTRSEPYEAGLRDPDRTNARGTHCWIGNVWRMSTVDPTWRKERLRNGMTRGKISNSKDQPAALHPCQKPLLFAERMIRASTRPGDTVWVPFGGTLREMVAAERMARGKPGEARRVVTCELNADGVDYIGPAVAQAQGLPTQTTGQADLFGGGQ